MTPPANAPPAPRSLRPIARSAPLLTILRANLLKTSRNLPVISDSWESVAEKLRLGLRIDAIRSQFVRNNDAGATGLAAQRPIAGCSGRVRARNQRGCRDPAGARAGTSAGVATVPDARGSSCLARHFGPGPRM